MIKSQNVFLICVQTSEKDPGIISFLGVPLTGERQRSRKAEVARLVFGDTDVVGASLT